MTAHGAGLDPSPLATLAAMGATPAPDAVRRAADAVARDGSPGLALRLLALVDPDPGHPVDQTARTLDPDGGMLTAGEVRDRVDEAVAALVESRPHLREHAATLRAAAASLRVASVTGGVVVLRETETRPGGRSSTRPGQSPPPFDAALPVRDPAEALDLPAPAMTLVVGTLGTPDPVTFAQLLALETEHRFRVPFELIEPDPARFTALLAATDVDVWRGDRIGVYLGPEARARYLRALEGTPWRSPVRRLIPIRSGLVALAPTAAELESIFRRRAAAQAESARRATERSAAVDDRARAARFQEAAAGRGGLRVAGFTTRWSTVLQHAMRDLARAFDRAGHHMTVVTEPSPSASGVDVAAAIDSIEPDLVFSINHLRFETGDRIPDTMPMVSWVQDHMPALWTVDAGRSVNDRELVVHPSPSVMAALYDYPADRIIPSHNLTDPETFSGEPLEEAALAPWRCDVSYVSNQSESPILLARRLAGGEAVLQRVLGALVERLHARLESAPWITPADQQRVLLEAEQASGLSIPPDTRCRHLMPMLQMLLDRVFRHQALGWVAAWCERHGRSFRLYGRGWSAHERFGRFAAGEISNGEAIRALSQASAVNLQLNGNGSHHQRLLDAVASGGFVLSRACWSDSVSEASREVRRIIAARSLESLGDVLESARRDPTLAEALGRLETLTGAPIATADDPRRRAYHELQRRCGNTIDCLFDDDGLYRILAQGLTISYRGASDLPGFGPASFRSERELGERLERFLDRPSDRDEIVASMRPAVLRHDTTDALVARVLDHFADRLAHPGAAPRSTACAG